MGQLLPGGSRMKELQCLSLGLIMGQQLPRGSWMTELQCLSLGLIMGQLMPHGSRMTAAMSFFRFDNGTAVATWLTDDRAAMSSL